MLTEESKIHNIINGIIDEYEKKTNIKTFQESDLVSKGALNEIFEALVVKYKFGHFESAKFICFYFGITEEYLLGKLYERHVEDIKLNASVEFPDYKGKKEGFNLDFIFSD